MPIIAYCLDCKAQAPYRPTQLNCPSCNSQWLEAHYDYDQLGAELPELLSGRVFNLWRYRELLPVLQYNSSLTMGEGGTPLIRAANLGMMLGCPNIFIKDERQGPTASFKDRQAAVNIAALKEAGITEIVLASTGNVSIAYSAYAARAGIKLWAFLTSLVPAEKMREVALYGTQVVKVTGSYDQAKKLAAEFAQQRGLYLERGARSIPSVEAMKTIAFEIAEQLTALERSGESIAPPPGLQAPPWIAPDWYFQSISGGLGPLGVQKGFNELFQMGLIERVPALGGIQTDGCAPMVHAWKANRDTAEPVLSPRTHIATLSTGDPGRTYTLLRQRMFEAAQNNIKSHDLTSLPRPGIFDSVSDEETFRTMHILAKMEGISVEPASAVAFSGLIKLVRAGVILPTDTVVINCTGHTMPVESLILGEGWARSVTAPPVGEGAVAKQGVSEGQTAGQLPQPAETPQEGLLAALNQVSSDRYARVLIVDDTEDARRLIRRILQSQGSYALLEASNGRQALEMASQQNPDLIILDLMMPEIDGFAVLDALKAKPATAHIPVIVVTAKELTVEERRRLGNQVDLLLQKGQFMSDELLREVRALVEEDAFEA